MSRDDDGGAEGRARDRQERVDNGCRSVNGGSPGL